MGFIDQCGELARGAASALHSSINWVLSTFPKAGLPVWEDAIFSTKQLVFYLGTF